MHFESATAFTQRAYVGRLNPKKVAASIEIMNNQVTAVERRREPQPLRGCDQRRGSRYCIDVSRVAGYRNRRASDESPSRNRQEKRKVVFSIAGACILKRERH